MQKIKAERELNKRVFESVYSVHCWQSIYFLWNDVDFADKLYWSKQIT